MNKEFLVEMCSDVDLEGMAVYISYDAKKIALITYEDGIHNMKIELFPFGESKGPQVFPLEEFLVFLEKAKKLAIRCAKEDGIQ